VAGPLTLSGALPFTLRLRKEPKGCLLFYNSGWCPDFPPTSALWRRLTPPFHGLCRRSPGSPAIFYYTPPGTTFYDVDPIGFTPRQGLLGWSFCKLLGAGLLILVVGIIVFAAVLHDAESEGVRRPRKLLPINQSFKLAFGQDRDSQLLGLVVLRSRIRPHHYVSCLVTHRATHFSAVLSHNRFCLFSRAIR